MENVIRSEMESAVNQTSNKFTQLSIDLAGKTNTGPVLASCGDSEPGLSQDCGAHQAVECTWKSSCC
jgi:hypothetical protein